MSCGNCFNCRVERFFEKCYEYVIEYVEYFAHLFTVQFRVWKLWCQRDRAVMTEFQRAYVVMSFRCFVICSVMAVVSSLAGNIFCKKPIDYDAKKWSKLMGYWKLITYIVALLLMMSSSRFEVYSSIKKRYIMYAVTILMAFIPHFNAMGATLTPPKSLKFNDSYSVAMVGISGFAILKVARWFDTYNKLKFLFACFAATVVSLLCSTTIFVSMLGFVTLKGYIADVIIVSIIQFIHVDFVIGLFHLNEHNVFVQVITMLYFVEGL